MDDDVDLWVDAYLLIGGISLHTHTHTEPHTSGFSYPPADVTVYMFRRSRDLQHKRFIADHFINNRLIFPVRATDFRPCPTSTEPSSHLSISISLNK